MTNENAIKQLKRMKMDKSRTGDEYNAIVMAIKALEQEPCDCIGREDAIRISSGYCHFSNIPEELKKLPSVTPQPKTGHWIWELEDWNKWICSECGWSKRTDVHVRLGYDFCPSCGSYNGGNKDERVL